MTPITKKLHSQISAKKGRTPIEKNVIVVDENGNVLHMTYSKRARGLVKNGRARIIGENKICLLISQSNAAACPPKEILEELLMDNMDTNINNSNINEQDTPKDATMEYVLSRIDNIIAHTEYLQSALSTIEKIQNADSQYDSTGEAKANAVASAILSRETTNQQVLKLLEKMYDDLKPAKYSQSEDVAKLAQLSDMLCNFPPDVAAKLMAQAIDAIF